MCAQCEFKRSFNLRQALALLPKHWQVLCGTCTSSNNHHINFNGRCSDAACREMTDLMLVAGLLTPLWYTLLLPWTLCISAEFCYVGARPVLNSLLNSCRTYMMHVLHIISHNMLWHLLPWLFMGCWNCTKQNALLLFTFFMFSIKANIQNPFCTWLCRNGQSAPYQPCLSPYWLSVWGQWWFLQP